MRVICLNFGKFIKNKKYCLGDNFWGTLVACVYSGEPEVQFLVEGKTLLAL